MAVYLFLPIRARDIEERAQPISAALLSTKLAIRHLLRFRKVPVRVHAHINGPATPGEQTHWMEHFTSTFHPLALVTASPVADKIASVNYGLSQARAAGFKHFIVIDNDIVFRKQIFERLTDVHVCVNADAVCVWKLPLIVPCSSSFERLFAYATSVSLRLNIYRAPTGSLYCIDPHRVAEFPANCNEGDHLLTALNSFLCDDVFVASRPSATLDGEIQRRKRINAASRAIGYQRPHHDPDQLRALMKGFVLPTCVSRHRFGESRELTDHVMRSAL
jgi:hypothetical protein